MKVTDLKVLKSNAGWYIGRLTVEDGFPYSRESGYYASKEEAEVALKHLLALR